ncbi:MAG: ROK family protein [Thermomicrobiales bacterium]|nr:ROK family protein [Thermomicrobiales bacterium]
MATHAIGIDFGGTKLLTAVVEAESGQVVSEVKKRTRASDSANELIARLSESIEQAIEKAKLPRKRSIAGIGIGIAGQVDAGKGMLLGAPNLGAATINLPIGPRLSKVFDVPVALRNDVQIAAQGEARFGAGKDCDDFLCVFVGTGVGGSLVRNGTPLTGATGTAGEIGHLVIDANGRLCGCGGRGHLEAYASRTAITKAIIGDLKRGRPSILSELIGEPDEDEPGGMAIRSGVLAKAIKQGDELATETIMQAGTYLGLGLASAINLVNPKRIVLGGGVIEAVDLLFSVAANHARREALPTPAAEVEILRAELGDHGGVIGAALIGASEGRT